MAYGTATLKPSCGRSDTITQPSLKQCSPCCLKAERFKVLAVEPDVLHEDERMYVPVWRVVIVHGSNKLHVFA
jgi:hypothetical protein